MDNFHKQPIVQYSVLGIAGLILVGLVVYLSVRGDVALTPEQLVAAALTDDSPAEREKAAGALLAHPDATVEQLRQLWRDSQDTHVRAAAALGLGTRRDWESMPELIAALEDPTLLLRGRCAQAINLIVGEDFGFQADSAAAQRAETIAVITAKWPALHEGFLAKQKLAAANASPDIWQQTLNKRANE